MKHIFKKSIAACLALLILLSALPITALASEENAPVGWDGTVAANFERGSGTEDDPYIIVNGAQLAYFASNVENGTANYAGMFFELGADIVLNDTTDWEMWGEVDENGYTVAPANVWEPIGYVSKDYLFCGTMDGKGHTISGVYVNNSTYDYLGLFAGLSSGAVLKNLHVSASYIRGDEGIGGLVGTIDYPNKAVTIAECSFSGKAVGRSNIGGIVGYAYALSANRMLVTDCINNGDVCATYEVVGGIVGYAYNLQVNACTNNGALEAVGDIGGIGGVLRSSTVTACVNTADLSCSERVAGIVCEIRNGCVEACTNNGAVASTGYYAAAGITVSANSCTVEECVNNGDITSRSGAAGGIVCGFYGTTGAGDQIVYAAMTRCINYGSVSGDNAAGLGIVRYAKVTECVNEGAVSADYYAGGLFYDAESSLITDCYTNGDIFGVYRASGIADQAENIVIETCYVSGVISCDSAMSSFEPAVISDATNTVAENVYYLCTLDNKNGIGEYLSEEQAALAEGYENYDFLSVWEMGYREAYPYPTLRFFGSQTYRFCITYQDGEEIVKTALVSAGEPIDLTPPANDTYAFAYWKTVDGARYSVTDTLNATANITLTAVWMVKNTSADAWDGSVDTDWEGSGTEDDPYLIGTPAELAGIRAVLSNRDDWERYYDTCNAYFLQTADLLLNDGGDTFGETLIGQNEWTPIDDFDGHYDGGGYTISGVYICADSGEQGVFGYTNAEIADVTLEDSYIYSSKGEYVGGIAGHADSVLNCISGATVIGSSEYVGGAVGAVCRAEQCRNSGYVQGDMYVGGVAGMITDSTNGCTGCENDGEVRGNTYVGGIGGYVALLIDGENRGDIRGYDYVGGIAGQSYDLHNAVNRGAVCGNKNVGGVVGFGGANDSVNHGDVVGEESVGGVVGTASVLTANVYSTGNVCGKSNIGGVAGYISWETTLATSYAVGKVTATENADEWSVEYIGGVVGNLYEDSTLTDCYYLDTACAASNDYGTALTAQQMQTETAFSGFNFLKTWEFGFESDYPYPTLRDLGSKEYRYQVTYINEGAVYANRVYYMGVQINLKAPASSTYDFAYWRAEDGTRYAADDVLKASEDLTLTAIWQTRPNGYAWNGAVDTDWLGSGTKEDPYLISTPAEFAGIAAKMEEVWWEDFEDTYFLQTADLTINAGGDQFSDTVAGRFEWKPIEDFAGHYDGGGHTIRGVYINSYTNIAALFADIDGSLKNLTLADSYIASKNNAAGGFAIDLGGTIENCHNEAYVCGSYDVGGIAASVTWESGTVLDSSNSGAVQGEQNVGGIVGDLSRGTVSGCSNSGTVEGYPEESGSIGGIVGVTWHGSVIDSFNSGNVRGRSKVGGVVGYNDADLVDGCANFGSITGYGTVGGVCGDNSGKLTNSYNSGIVAFDNERYADQNGSGFGGVAGVNDDTIIGVYNIGDVFVSNGTRQIGGVVGYNSNTLREAYSVGTVTVGENSDYVGAVVGMNNGNAQSVYYADTSAVSDSYAVALNAEQLKTAEAYEGFDFDVNWTIDPTSDYPYPTLTGAPHKQYVTVTFVDPNGKTIASYHVEKGSAMPYPDMAKYNYEDAQYVYEFVSWSTNPTLATNDVTITATFRKVAKLFFASIEKQLTVGYGYSATNLQIDLESLYAQVVCTTTTDYRLLSDVTWDIEGYDPTVAGEVVLEGHLTLTDNPYYEMAQGATVTVTVTVLGEGDTTHVFEANDLRFETLGDGSLKVIGYDGEAQVLHIPQTVGGKTVAVIGENAFADADVLAVTLPATVHTVETGAFENASSLSMVVLPDSLHTVGERAFYNTALADVTCPAALSNIGTQAFGYYGATPTAVGGFTVYAFADTAAAAYAAENGFICVATQTAVDNDTDVSAVIPENLSLAVVAVGEGDYYDTAAGIFTETDGVKLMDISLYDGDLSVQPGGVMIVSMPIPDGFNADNCHIFRINDDGSYKDMEAEIVGDRLIFSTAHLSVYAVVEQHEDSVLVGDMTGDGTLNMRDALKMYQIASGRVQNDIPLAVSDLTGDGAVNMRDALKLFQIVSVGQ